MRTLVKILTITVLLVVLYVLLLVKSILIWPGVAVDFIRSNISYWTFHFRILANLSKSERITYRANSPGYFEHFGIRRKKK